MQLAQLLEEIKIGEDNYRQLKTSKELKESFDKDLSNIKVSDLINKINTNFIKDLNEETAPIISSFRKFENKISSIEERIEKNGSFSTAYAKMKYDSLSEEYVNLSKELKNKKSYRQFDINELAKATALIIHEAKFLAESGEFDFREKDFPDINESFSPIVKKELKLIEESIIK